jgi:hypothetical protein
MADSLDKMTDGLLEVFGRLDARDVECVATLQDLRGVD